MRIPTYCALLVLSAVAFADSWAPATPATYVSNTGQFRVTVFPRELGGNLSYFEDLIEDRASPGQAPEGRDECTATLEKLVGTEYQEVWRGALVNDVAPVHVLVSDDDGSFMTLDNWHSSGIGPHTLVIYSGNGEILKSYKLSDLFSKQAVDKLPRSVSSIRWRRNPRQMYDGTVILPMVKITEETNWDNLEFEDWTIDLSTGDIVKHGT